MVKRWIPVILIVALSFSNTLVHAEQPDEALKNTIPLAARAMDMSSYEARISYTMDEDTAEWSSGADPFEAILDRAKRSGVGEAILMQLKWMGNARTNIIQPVLEIYYFGSSDVNAGAVSVRVGNRRYDVKAWSETVKMGRRNAEHILAPLQEGWIELLSSLAVADKYSILLHGNKRNRTTDVVRGYKGANTRKRLESLSFECFSLTEEIAEYHLWDLSSKTWKAKYGFEPKVDEISIADENVYEMLWMGNSGKEVRELEALLITRLFMVGSISGVYNDRVREAVIRAQKHFGLMQTGSADKRLLSELSNTATQRSDAHLFVYESQNIDGFQLRLDRYWFAHTVEPSVPNSELKKGYMADDRDNTLIVFDGEIRNNNTTTLKLDWQLKGSVILDNYSYRCVFMCESNLGSTFSNLLLPQGVSRLIVVAEIPSVAISTQPIMLIIESNDESLTYFGDLLAY